MKKSEYPQRERLTAEDAADELRWIRNILETSNGGDDYIKSVDSVVMIRKIDVLSRVIQFLTNQKECELIPL